MSTCLITDDRAIFGGRITGGGTNIGKISGVPAWDGAGMQKRIQTRDRALGALGSLEVAEDFAGGKVAKGRRYQDEEVEARLALQYNFSGR